MMSIEDQEIEYKIQVDDDVDGDHGSESKEIKYVIRGLKTIDEIGDWSKFCASVFAYKANPPPASYFQRHYMNDPNKGAPSLIRVAIVVNDNEDGKNKPTTTTPPKIVASCRLFLRTISTGSGSTKGRNLSAGGIGEVCTSNDHRRRGLSKMLVQNCIQIMKERKLQLSLLHAAPNFFPVYAKIGNYVTSKSCWSTIEVDLKTLSSSTTTTATTISLSSKKYSIRKAIFPNDSNRLSQLHQQYSERRFAGCIVRSLDYWNTYLSEELGESLLVLSDDHIDDDQHIVGWISVRHRGGNNRIQLPEFGIDESLIETSKALSLLLSAAINQLSTPAVDDNFILILPTFVIDQVRGTSTDDDGLKLSCFVWSTLKSEDDSGWMYKVFDDQIDLTSIQGTNNNPPHLIWPADSF